LGGKKKTIKIQKTWNKPLIWKLRPNSKLPCKSELDPHRKNLKTSSNPSYNPPKKKLQRLKNSNEGCMQRWSLHTKEDDDSKVTMTNFRANVFILFKKESFQREDRKSLQFFT